MRKILVIGGGAAGMFAAVNAAESGHEVHIYEHNEKLGKKLYITGKGRCNVTNACDSPEDLFRNTVTNPRFLYSAFYTFDNHDMMTYLTSVGLQLKVERGQRVFPVSDKSSDVIQALASDLKRKGVHIHLNQNVSHLLTENGKISGICLADGRTIEGNAVILATGGISYASTGSTGDGHRMAEEVGHTITELRPSLVPLNIQETWCRELQGLSLKNISFSLKQGKKVFYKDFGEMMFTHFGITGPVVLSGSTGIAGYLKKGDVLAVIDLKPSISAEQLDARLLRDFDKHINKQIRNALSELLPSSLIPVIIELADIDPYKIVHDLTREERSRLVYQIKNLTMTVTGTRGLNEAIITQGGIKVKEIEPATMASKLIPGLYFAGEIIDLDAVTGGFNLQIAWSTAYMAGRAAADYCSI
jgi:predicted Rossmann fold flavoprotein